MAFSRTVAGIGSRGGRVTTKDDWVEYGARPSSAASWPAADLPAAREDGSEDV